MNTLSRAKSLLSGFIKLLSRTSLRGMVLLLGLVLMVFSWRPSMVEELDSQFFKLGTWLVEAPLGAKGIVLIQVPQEKLELWQSDINQAAELGVLLSNILDTSNSIVGVVLENPIDARTAKADKLLESIAGRGGKDSKILGEAEELVRRKGFLLEFLSSERVVVGVLDRRFPDTRSYLSDWGSLSGIPAALRTWLWSEDHLNPVDLPGSAVQHHPIYRSAVNQVVVVRDTQGATASGSFLLNYLSAEQRRAGVQQTEYVWHRDRGIQLGSMHIATSPSGAIMPFYGSTSRMSPGVETISLEEAMARGSFPPRVYISGENSQLAKSMAIAALSLEDGRVAYSPWWYVPFAKLLSLFFALYLVFFLPRISRSTGFLLSVLIVFVVVVAQLVTLATQKLWLPLSAQLLWLALGHMLILVWALRREEWQKLKLRADEASIQQSSMLMDKGDIKMSFEVLHNCSTCEPVLSRLYEIGSAYASKRQYAQAVKVLEALKGRKKMYKDVNEKIEALRSMVNSVDKQPDSGTAPLTVESTVVLDTPQIERPVLGRYEIREELGRGAMGTVYLAFDPKISRNVAVKTLNYLQFQDQQLEGIKSRFYREAEAAGRLSHPHIVSVFDVGEEHDMAFIAMDFAEGKPLNSFVRKETLLPLFEVYRIICDVAQALEYAHKNQIVHRDVKPGNIMYCPAPYQLKVTDFGIARLVDNSKTSTGEILGSPLYMAPEQLKGKRVTHHADIFSLGVTFYQLLTGRLPFEGENLASLTYEIIHGKYKGVRSVRKDLPNSAARIVNQALQKIPGDRYTSAGDMALTLKKAIKRDFAHEAKRAGYL